MGSIAKERLREAHQPRWHSVWFWMTYLGIFVVGETVLIFFIRQGWYIATVPLMLVVGHVMHVHLLAFHEAAHETLCPNRFLNEAVGIFVGVNGFMSLSIFRAVHHSHHAFLTTERDEELWPFVQPRTPLWQRYLHAFGELFLGLICTPLLFLRAFLKRDSIIRESALRWRVWGELGLIVVSWSSILATVAWFDVWNYFCVLYLVPAWLAGNIQSLRKFVEHMGLMGDSVLSTTRSVVINSMAGRLFALSVFNITYHGVHHQFARMHPFELPRFPEMLEPETAEELPPFPSHRQAIWDMLRHLANPRVGAQWLGRTVVSTRRRGSKAREGTIARLEQNESVG